MILQIWDKNYSTDYNKAKKENEFKEQTQLNEKNIVEIDIDSKIKDNIVVSDKTELKSMSNILNLFSFSKKSNKENDLNGSNQKEKLKEEITIVNNEENQNIIDLIDYGKYKIENNNNNHTYTECLSVSNDPADFYWILFTDQFQKIWLTVSHALN